MKYTTALLSIAAVAAAAPTEYGPPKGGWESVDYPKDAGKDAVPAGGWESVKYPAGTGENLPSYPAGTGGSAACPSAASPFDFTSVYTIYATPDQVVNGTTPTGGLAGASGTYRLGLNSLTNTICYNITLYDFQGEYRSPALTATHLHEAAKGASGPPRIAFPNPSGDGHVRTSLGCMSGPFMTGLKGPDGVTDTGAGFEVGQIEKNPAGFFADVHSSLAVPGAVRGQLA